MGGLKNMVTKVAVKLLNIQPAVSNPITIQEPLSFEGNVMKNRIWYRGDSSELDQFFKQSAFDLTSKSRFWAAVPSRSLNIRKMHSGVPAIIVETLADIVTSDINSIDMEETQEKIWEDISKDNKFNKTIKKSIIETLVAGDGAFKVTIDTDLTPYPILEYYSGERVDYTVKRGRLQEVLFYTDYSVKNKNYRLIETFGKGYIKNRLVDDRGLEVSLFTVPELSELKDVTFDSNFMMAVPMKFFESQKWNGRGKSIFDNKTDSFDALDEVISQWIDAIRAGRVQKYIPEDLIPRDPKTGELMQPNPFDNQFIQLNSSFSEKEGSKTELLQPEIKYEAFVESYAKALDMCLQGIISPATLGIDLKKLDNAEAQREKEKTTLYTRQKIIDELQEVMPELINVVFKTYNVMSNKSAGEDLEISVNFGEYASPSFNDKVETVGKAKTYGVMSIEQCVQELYGDTWTDEEKLEEVKRLKEEQGVMEAEEPKTIDEEELNLDDTIEGEEDGQE
ncbi:phage portal protein [Clostridium algidicarnis]|nr:phage portal protein [Clostridium algidicarnis]MBU3250294.1 phage portal protein [Clostridium algidicarnis]